jgi:hypothetical protein
MKPRLCSYPIRLALLLSIAAAGSLHAADIYRWTDAEGRVHFGERPPQGVGEPVRLPGGHSAPDPALSARRERQQRLLDAYAHERQQREQQAAGVAARERERERRCEVLSGRWQALAWGGPVYIEDEAGARQYVSDEEREQRQRDIASSYARHCAGQPRLGSGGR